MATRCYFSAADPAPVSPAFDAGWNYTSEAGRYLLNSVKGASALTIGTQIGPWTATAGQTALDRQYVSAPLSGAQTITGTIKLQLLVRELASTDNVDGLWITVYVVSGDGTTVTGTLLVLANYGSTAEFLDTGYRNKTGADGDALSSVSANDGDRIVIEIGYSNSTAATTPEASAKWGETGTDLPENETQTTDGVGWVEFSQTLTFADYARTTQIGVEVLSDPDPNVRLTQAGVEVLGSINPVGQVTQVGAEVLLTGNPNALISQAGTEVLIDMSNTVYAVISQAGIEVLIDNLKGEFCQIILI